MKKFLLTMACALGIVLGVNAETVSCDYTTQNLPSGQALTTTTYGEVVTVSYSKGTNSSNPPKYYNSTSSLDATTRFYSGNQITFAIEDGYTITEIQFVIKNNKKFDSASTATAGTLDAPNAKWSGSAQNVTITMGGSGQVHIGSWTLTYSGGDAPQPTTVTAPEITCENNTVTITVEDGATAHYTIDGTEPTAASTQYDKPFAITEDTTVKAIAVKDGEESTVTSFEAKYIGTYESYADLVALGSGTQGIVTNVTGIYKNGDRLYTVDSYGGFMLLTDADKFSGLTEFANGDHFASVTGKYMQNPAQLAGATLGEKTAGTAVEPTTLTLDAITSDIVNNYVRIENVTIAKTSSNNNYTMTDANGNTFKLYNTFYNPTRYDVITVPEGRGFTVTGFVGIYGGSLQITPILFEGGQVAAPTFSIAPGDVYEGTTLVLFNETEDATIYYTTSDAESYDDTWTEYEGRTIAINEPTTFKAIAVKTGMLDSDIASASYSIIEPFEPTETSTFTFDFGNPKTLAPEVNAPAQSKGTDLSNKFLKNGIVTIAFSGQEEHATSMPRIYNSAGKYDLRIYNSQYFTISVPEGYILGDITFGHYSTGKMNSLNCGKNGTYTASGTKATWTCKMGDKLPYDTVESVKFSATDGVYIQTITVEYEHGTPTGVDNIAVDDENAPAVYYNLQGVRVDNPGPGLYIVRRGNTATKTLVQ